jgi:tetratricopeptide (TPR) repeat protein
MNIRETKKARIICAMLGGCLSLASSVLAQSGMTSNFGGSVPDTMTPQKITQDNLQLQLDEAAAQAYQAGKYDEAIADAKQAMSVRIMDILGPRVLAQALEAKGDTARALQAYQALADRGSSHPADLLPYALMLLHQGQWSMALAAYEKALPYVGDGNLLRADNDFAPDVPEPTALEAAIHVARGLTYSTGDLVTPHAQNDKALTEFQKATALAPDSALVNYYYGYGLRRSGRKADAEVAFKKAAALDENHGDVKAAAEAALAGR